MGIEVKITADSTADLHSQLASLLAGTAQNFVVPQGAIEPKPDPIATDKPARASRKKIEPKPGVVAEMVDEGNEPTGSTEPGTPSSGTASEATESGAAAQENEPTVEYVDVQKAVTQLGAAKGRDAVVKVLNDLGVDHATKLKPEQWADAIAELQAAKEA